MRKLNRRSLGLTAIRVARVILGGVLLLAILWVSIPASAIATGPMCQLACCAGRAPHAVGSCMNGSCHAFLTSHHKRSHSHHEAPSQRAEQLCGLQRLSMNTNRLPLMRVTIDFDSEGYSDQSRDRSNSASNQARVSTTALTKPCQPDCGSCASGFTSSKRQRHAAAGAYADRPRPPCDVRPGNVDYSPTRNLSAICRRSAPRGPPLPFLA